MIALKVVDTDQGEIFVLENGEGIRSWTYESDIERRAKMLCAREFVEGYGYAVHVLAPHFPKKPEDNPRSGPCCYELTDCGGEQYWISTGCDCRNYGDAQDAARWADRMNDYLRVSRALAKRGITL